jgi:Polyketide cyclase / dehydrase and lipid transport
MELLMEITREIELDAPADDVWRLLTDPDELAGWVGDEIREAEVQRRDDTRTVTWTWAPHGVETRVEVELVESGDHSVLRVVERGPFAAARACSLGDAWDDRLFGLEVRCLADRFALVVR